MPPHPRDNLFGRPVPLDRVREVVANALRPILASPHHRAEAAALVVDRLSYFKLLADDVLQEQVVASAVAQGDRRQWLIDKAVRDLAERHLHQLEAALRLLAPGESLCLHEPPPWSPESFNPDPGHLYGLLLVQDGHVLPEGATCAVGGARTLYGPMTEGLLTEVRARGERGRRYAAWEFIDRGEYIQAVCRNCPPGAPRVGELRSGDQERVFAQMDEHQRDGHHRCSGELHVTPHAGCFLR